MRTRKEKHKENKKPQREGEVQGNWSRTVPYARSLIDWYGRGLVGGAWSGDGGTQMVTEIV